MTEHLEFDFAARPPLSDVDQLVAYLKQRPGFHTAAKLAGFMGNTERNILKLAEMADGMIVSGPGSPGYCHLNHCPAEMIAHIADKLISQGRNMIRRAIRTRKRARALIH